MIETYEKLNKLWSDLIEYVIWEEPSSVSAFPVVTIEPTATIKMKKAIAGLGEEMTTLQLGQHMLKYHMAWYRLVTSTICPDEWDDKSNYRLASGLVVSREDPEEREFREGEVRDDDRKRIYTPENDHLPGAIEVPKGSDGKEDGRTERRRKEKGFGEDHKGKGEIGEAPGHVGQTTR